jgi:hypothetical protein
MWETFGRLGAPPRYIGDPDRKVLMAPERIFRCWRPLRGLTTRFTPPTNTITELRIALDVQLRPSTRSLLGLRHKYADCWKGNLLTIRIGAVPHGASSVINSRRLGTSPCRKQVVCYARHRTPIR